MTDWQDIESAPRDGTLIRLWMEPVNERYIVPAPKTGIELENIVFGIYPKAVDAWWNRKRFEGVRELYPEVDESCGWSTKCGTASYKPTHWMLPPDAPT